MLKKKQTNTKEKKTNAKDCMRKWTNEKEKKPRCRSFHMR